MELYLDEYSYEEFIEICRRLLNIKYRLPLDISDRISYLAWNRMKSKDVRDVLKIGKLSKNMSEVDWLVDVQIKYRKYKKYQ